MLHFRRVAAHIATTVTIGFLQPASTALADLTLSLEPAKHNTLFEYSSRVSNGAGAHLYAGHNFRGDRHGAVAFDLTRIPRGAQLTDASVVLHLSNPWPVRASQLSLHRFVFDWGESSSQEAGPSGDGAPARTGDA